MNKESINTARIARRAVAQLLLVPVLLFSLLTPVYAQDAEELARQQMEVMKQYMEAAGMSEEDMAKSEAMIKSSMGPIVEAQAAQEAQEQATFEASSAGLGKAVISIAGQEAELRITKCVLEDSGNWNVEAQDRAMSKSSLSMSGDTHYRRSILWMRLKDVGAVEDKWIEPMVPMDNGRVTWAGTAQAYLEGGDYGEAPISLSIDCEPGS